MGLIVADTTERETGKERECGRKEGWGIKPFDTVTPHSSIEQQQKRTMMMGDDKFVLMYKDQTRPELLEWRIMESRWIR